MNNPSVKPIKTLPWEYDERRFEKEANLDDYTESPAATGPIRFSIGGMTEISFGTVNQTGGVVIEKVVSVTGDTLESAADAGIDLWRRFIGSSSEKANGMQQTETAQNTQGNLSSADTTSVAPDHETSLLRQQVVREYLAKLQQNQSEIARSQQVNESLRITNRVVTTEDAEKVGTTGEHLFDVSTLHAIDQAEAVVATKIEDQQQEESIAATNPKGAFSIGENELSMREGNSKFGGVGDTGGPG